MPRQPRQIPSRPALTEEQIAAARYVGSPEHKDRAWWNGLPEVFVGKDGKAHRHGKEDTTICPLVTAADQAKATGWLREALTLGHFKYLEGDKDYPSRVWYMEAPGKFWFGRTVNSVRGEYKGWPEREEKIREIFGRLD